MSQSLLVSFVVEIFGAFLGVLGAIIISRKEHRKRANGLVMSLNDELGKVYIDISRRVYEKEVFFRYEIPVWEASLKSNIHIEIPYEVYKDYVDVYQMIEYANLIEMEWCHCRIMDQTGTGENLIRKSYIEMMATEREKLSAQIKKQIENVLKTKQ